MASIVDSEGIVNMTQLTQSLNRTLPTYARPLFIRFIQEADTTGTFKLKKNKLRDEGFNINLFHDKVFYLDSKSQQYQTLTPEVYSDIVLGKIRI
uniref:AMP-binding enzyme C-terminal domain-containing protein n=1 Tax=Biomphalaria glabrata TaxID=6526 RepID=A0A2C9LW05_BIOGL